MCACVRACVCGEAVYTAATELLWKEMVERGGVGGRGMSSLSRTCRCVGHRGGGAWGGHPIYKKYCCIIHVNSYNILNLYFIIIST